MPEFDSTTRDKIVELRGLHRLAVEIESYEIAKVEWPSPTGTKYYSVVPSDEVASVAPPLDSPIELRIIPDSNPDWFLPVSMDATIGDEEVDLEMWDGDEGFSQLLVDHGEGVKTTLYYWFPQVELLLPVWLGHLGLEEESTVESVKVKAAQGFRASDVNLPSRAHYDFCMAVFGGLLLTQADIDENDCPYNFHLGGGIGNNNPDTGLPWTFCDRRDHQSCIDRGVDPKYHLSHLTMGSTLVNGQTHGPNLLSTSEGNETNLPDPVRVVLAPRRIYGMPVMVFRRDLNNNHPDQGWFAAMYEGPEGPQAYVSGARFTVGGKTQNVVAMHYAYRLGTRGQTSAGSDLSSHGYSGTGHLRYNFGYTTPEEIGPGDATADAFWGGLSNIRVYSDPDTYVETTTSNRAWHILRMLCDKRWGFGLSYELLNIQSFIDAAAWCETSVTFTDTFGTAWTHIRSDSYPELIGKKVQQQFEDICLAGNLSRPFMFDGKINILPLRALTVDELADCPVFTDEGDDGRNVIFEDGKSTLTISRKRDRDLVNRVEASIDDWSKEYVQTPLRPVEDLDAQFRAGSVQGLGTKLKKVNNKQYSFLGIVNEPQAIKMQWSILDRGPFDEGGLQNNLTLKFKIWFMDSLDLHLDKVIKVTSSRLVKYGFTYFRVKKMQRQSDLTVELEVQAYNETYMNAFEVDYVAPPPQTCSLDGDCPDGYICENGVCVPYDPPLCRPAFGTITFGNGVLNVGIEPTC